MDSVCRDAQQQSILQILHTRNKVTNQFTEK